MKCPYDEFECDWPVTTGDIECAACVHYKNETASTSLLDWLKTLFVKK